MNLHGGHKNNDEINSINTIYRVSGHIVLSKHYTFLSGRKKCHPHLVKVDNYKLLMYVTLNLKHS